MGEQSQLPGVAPHRVEITEFAHLLSVGEFYGIQNALERLEKTPESKRAPGFAYAVALIEAMSANARANLMHRNLRAVAANRINIAEMKSIGLEGMTIVVTPYAPGEEMA